MLMPQRSHFAPSSSSQLFDDSSISEGDASDEALLLVVCGSEIEDDFCDEETVSFSSRHDDENLVVVEPNHPLEIERNNGIENEWKNPQIKKRIADEMFNSSLFPSFINQSSSSSSFESFFSESSENQNKRHLDSLAVIQSLPDLTQDTNPSKRCCRGSTSPKLPWRLRSAGSDSAIPQTNTEDKAGHIEAVGDPSIILHPYIDPLDGMRNTIVDKKNFECPNENLLSIRKQSTSSSLFSLTPISTGPVSNANFSHKNQHEWNIGETENDNKEISVLTSEKTEQSKTKKTQKEEEIIIETQMTFSESSNQRKLIDFGSIGTSTLQTDESENRSLMSWTAQSRAQKALSKVYDSNVNYLFECWLVTLSNDVLTQQLRALRADNDRFLKQLNILQNESNENELSITISNLHEILEDLHETVAVDSNDSKMRCTMKSYVQTQNETWKKSSVPMSSETVKLPQWTDPQPIIEQQLQSSNTSTAIKPKLNLMNDFSPLSVIGVSAGIPIDDKSITQTSKDSCNKGFPQSISNLSNDISGLILPDFNQWTGISSSTPPNDEPVTKASSICPLFTPLQGAPRPNGFPPPLVPPESVINNIPYQKESLCNSSSTVEVHSHNYSEPLSTCFVSNNMKLNLTAAEIDFRNIRSHQLSNLSGASIVDHSSLTENWFSPLYQSSYNHHNQNCEDFNWNNNAQHIGTHWDCPKLLGLPDGMSIMEDQQRCNNQYYDQDCYALPMNQLYNKGLYYGQPGSSYIPYDQGYYNRWSILGHQRRIGPSRFRRSRSSLWSSSSHGLLSTGSAGQYITSTNDRTNLPGYSELPIALVPPPSTANRHSKKTNSKNMQQGSEQNNGRNNNNNKLMNVSYIDSINKKNCSVSTSNQNWTQTVNSQFERLPSSLFTSGFHSEFNSKQNEQEHSKTSSSIDSIDSVFAIDSIDERVLPSWTTTQTGSLDYSEVSSDSQLFNPFLGLNCFSNDSQIFQFQFDSGNSIY